MLRSLTLLVVAGALVLAPPVSASSGPVPGVSAAPVVRCANVAKLTGAAYAYNLCGVPDLDQVRVTNGAFIGLPGKGHNYCAPTSTTNLFAYLATKGFVDDPAVKDYTQAANFNEASQDVNQLGDLMGTTAADGTTDGMVPGIVAWLQAHGTPKVKVAGGGGASLNLITSSFTSGGEYSPDIGAMAQDAINGGLIVGVVGFYSPITDPVTGATHLMRTGGHLVSLVRAAGTLGTTAATLGVHDPATDWINDDIQSPYSTDTWTLGAAQPDTYFWQDTDGSLHTYTATLPSVNASTSTLFDGYVTLEPKTEVSVVHLHQLVFYAPAFTKRGPGPVERIGGHVVRVIDAPGAVTAIALAPDGVQHPFLVKGSAKVYDANPLTGAITTFADAPAGARLLTYGGRRQTLFVAGAHGLVALDRSGATIGQAKLSAAPDALAYDTRHDRLVTVDAAKGSIHFFDAGLRPVGSARFKASALAGKGKVGVAISSTGGVLLRRDGAASTVVGALPAVQRGARASALPALSLRPVKLAVKHAATGLAVDDFGHMFVSVRGRLVELGSDGKPVARSPYNGVPAGPTIAIARSFTNADLAMPKRLDYIPPDREGPALPNLKLVPTAGNAFTVTNAGLDAAGPFSVTITHTSRAGVPSVESYAFPGLAAGASVTHAHACSATALPIAIDPGNQVAESDETDNTGMTNPCVATA